MVDNTWDSVPLASVYNITLLHSRALVYGVRVLADLPPSLLHNCSAQIQGSVLISDINQFDMLLDKHGIVCLSSENVFAMDIHDSLLSPLLHLFKPLPSPLSASSDQVPLAANDTCTRYILPGAYWGLNNQMYSIVKGLALAKHMNACVVEPSFLIDYGEQGNNWDIYRLSVMFDSAAFRLKTHSLFGRQVLSTLPPSLIPACLMMLSIDDTHIIPKGTNGLGPFSALLERHSVLCPSAYNSLTGHTADVYGLGGVFQPSQEYAQILQYALEQLALRNATSYAAVHARTEPDWSFFCAKNPNLPHECYTSDANMLQYLQKHPPPSNTLFIASGYQSVAHFPLLCSYYACVFHSDLFNASYGGYFRKLTTGAWIDFLLCLHASAFYGNSFSTFSIQLMYRRKAENHPNPVNYYNVLV